MIKSLTAMAALALAAATSTISTNPNGYAPSMNWKEIQAIPAPYTKPQDDLDRIVLESLIKYHKKEGMTYREAIGAIHFQIAQDWVTIQNDYSPFEIDGESFRVNFYKRAGLCIDYACEAAALVSDENRPPLMLLLHGDIGRHAVFLYRTQNGFGCMGNTPMDPKYKTVKDLALALGPFSHYAVIDLNEAYPNQEWIHGEVELQELNHTEWKRIQDEP